MKSLRTLLVLLGVTLPFLAWADGGSIANGGTTVDQTGAVIGSGGCTADYTATQGTDGRWSVTVHWMAGLTGAGECGVAWRQYDVGGGILGTTNLVVQNTPGTTSGTSSFLTSVTPGSYIRLWCFATASILYNSPSYVDSTGSGHEKFFTTNTSTVRVRGVNPNGVAMRIYVFKPGTTEEIGHLDVGAHAAYDQSFTLPPGVGSVDLKVFLAATLGGDGVSWVETATPDAGTPEPTQAGVPGFSELTPDIPGSQPTVGKAPANIVWSSVNTNTPTTLANTLDKATFKEGVGQILEVFKASTAGGSGSDMAGVNTRLDAIKGDTAHLDGIEKALTEGSADAVTFPSSGDATARTDLNPSTVQGTVSKLPSAPSVIVPGVVSSFTLPVSIAGTSYDQTVDLSKFSVPIEIFKGLVRAVLTVWFFFLAVRAIRDAFSG